MDRLGAPRDVPESRRLGGAAVAAVLRAARGCPAAVIDSTWYPYALPWVRELGAPVVELRCRVPLDVARARYSARSRDARHLDGDRTDDELWGSEVAPLGVGPLLDVDTSVPVDVASLAARVRSVVERHGRTPHRSP